MRGDRGRKGSEPPAVSVVMTTYNGMAYVSEAIASIQFQTVDNWELIVIDDGSSDDTVAAVLSTGDARVRVIQNAVNIGQTASLNLGLEEARSGLIARLDQDDLAMPTRLAEQLEMFEAHPELVLVGSWADIIDSEGQKTGDFRPPSYDDEIRRDLIEKLWANPIAHSAVMYRRDDALLAGGYPSNVRLANDYALWLRLLRLGAFANIPKPLCRLRLHEGQASRGPAFAESAREVLIANEHLDNDLRPTGAAERRWRAARGEYSLEMLGVLLTTQFAPAVFRKHVPFLLKTAVCNPSGFLRIPAVLRRALGNRQSAGGGP